MFTKLDNTSRSSLEVLNALYQYDDFMASIKTLIDLGCGNGDDLLWWGTATTRDERPEPLNIKCVGIDLAENLARVKPYSNVTYRRADFEEPISPIPEGFDVLWCYDSFQYCKRPLDTLKAWWNIASPGAMLCLSVPQTTNFRQRQNQFYLQSGCFYHHTVVSLIYMLSTAGWDCRSGFFLKQPNKDFIHCVVYRHDSGPLDPKSVTWYDLMDQGRLPESADSSVHAHGYLRQQDLVLPWLDKSFHVMSSQ